MHQKKYVSPAEPDSSAYPGNFSFVQYLKQEMDMDTQEGTIQGLCKEEAAELQKLYGKNQWIPEPRHSLFKKLTSAVLEPIFLLLITASVIYFLLGEAGDGIIMLIFVLGIILMDVLQEWKTDNALKALKTLSQPRVKAVRDFKVIPIDCRELVPGDMILVEEGCRIPADGFVLASHDFCIDESILTGESREVWKTPTSLGIAEAKLKLNTASLEFHHKEYCYAGTMVTQGSAAIIVHKIGKDTMYGQIGLCMAEETNRLSPLQHQMKSLTKNCTLLAFLLFWLVGIITYFNLRGVNTISRIIESFLSGIVLSLSMIPAEFPVILTIFLSMGALRLTKKQALIRKLTAVETLGCVSVLCVDKTGTITKNQMTLTQVYPLGCTKEDMIKTALLSCDRKPHDPMETAIQEYGAKSGISLEEIYNHPFLYGYPFTQECKTMAHIWKIDGKTGIAAKGSPEWLLAHSNLSEKEQSDLEAKICGYTGEGLRVLGVAFMDIPEGGRFPVDLDMCTFHFLGLLGFLDPPKDSIKENIKKCTEAGIRVIMITGDNGETAVSIARQIQLPGNKTCMTGKELEQIGNGELQEGVKHINLFSRVVPEQKLRIVKALQNNGEIVAMTGDGVNDAPALKCADIGIAMGKKGSEVTREAAGLILLNDNFSTILHAIEDGRRIYGNIRKAIGYVFTIHIPIALICLLGPLLHILPEELMLLPLHVVLLELLMNPICAAVIERQPAEGNCMKKPPRSPNEELLDKRILRKSISQGFGVFLSSFGTYYLYLSFCPGQAETARTLGLSILILSNLYLILVNCSDWEYAHQAVRKLKKEKGIILVVTTAFLMLILIIYSPLQVPLRLKQLSPGWFLMTVILSFLFVFWYEGVKFVKKKRRKNDSE